MQFMPLVLDCMVLLFCNFAPFYVFGVLRTMHFKKLQLKSDDYCANTSSNEDFGNNSGIMQSNGNNSRECYKNK